MKKTDWAQFYSEEDFSSEEIGYFDLIAKILNCATYGEMEALNDFNGTDKDWEDFDSIVPERDCEGVVLDINDCLISILPMKDGKVYVKYFLNGGPGIGIATWYFRKV